MPISNPLRAMFAAVPDECFVGITSFDGNFPKTSFYELSSIDDAYAMALDENKAHRNVYISMKCFNERPSKGRGTAGDPGLFPMVWVDLDYGFEGHKSSKNPPDQAAALGLLSRFAVPPSLTAFSGHGLQAFWFLKTPIDASSAEGQALARRTVRAVQATIAYYASEKGWQMDNTSDLARIMRVPGTVNYKDPEKPVEGAILNLDPTRRYTAQTLLEACLPETKFGKRTCGTMSITRHSCAQRKPSEASVIPVSRRNSTMASLAGSMQRRGMSVQAIAAALRAENETRCAEPLDEDEIEVIAASISRYEPARTPADLVVEAVDALEGMVPKISMEPDRAFCEDVVQALAVLSTFDQVAYSRMKTKIKNAAKGKVPIKELEMSVKAAAGRLRMERQVKQNEAAILEPIFPEIGFDIQLPPNYSMSETGIVRCVRGAEELAFPCPVALSRCFRNPHTGLEMVELIFRRAGQVRRVAAERSVIFSRTRIMDLADNGLPVTSENAKDLVVFLSELERLNEVPMVSCAARLGWIGDGSILPWDTGAAYLDARGFEETAAAFDRRGSLAEWIKLTAPVRASLPGRMLLAAAYASPIVSLVGARTSGIMIWGGSQAGKTAALKAAVSIYGHPDKLMLNMYATRVSLEQQASFLHHLPLFIDERQLAGNDQALEQLVYMISGGAGKGRGRKNGGVQARGQWDNLALITGEFPISSDSSAAGVRGRLLEINVTKVVESEIGSLLHRELPGQFGTAGPVFLDGLKRSVGTIRESYEAWLKRVTREYPKISGSHAALLALLGLADELASLSVHGETAEASASGAWNFVQELATQVVTTAELDDAERAKNWVISKYLENAHKFERGDHGQSFEFGAMLPGVLQIAPSILNRFLHEGGFHPARSKADFAQRGWLKQFPAKDGSITIAKFGKCEGYGSEKKGYWNYLAFPEWAISKEERETFGTQDAILDGAIN